jgi:hypothetical protein
MEKPDYMSRCIILPDDAIVRRIKDGRSSVTLKPLLKTLLLLASGCLLVMTAQAESSHATEKSPTVLERTGAAIERGAKATANGIERGAKATAHGVERGAQATGRALKKVSQKIGISKDSDS